MTETQWYKVGGHTFCISNYSNSSLLSNLTNCHPFRITEAEGNTSAECLFRLSIEESLQKPVFTGNFIIEFEGEGTQIQLYETSSNELLFFIFANKTQKHLIAMLKVEVSSYLATLILPTHLNLHWKTFAINNTLMLLYALSTACRNTILIHASVAVCHNRAYVFLGKSGTGKSTHSRLWLQYIEGTHLLNDDNPVIRLQDDKVFVYGTPWSGKTPCYRNESYRLGGIIRLSQSAENNIVQLQGVAAYAAVSPSASAIRWKRKYADGLHTTLSRLTSLAEIYHLQCRPDKEAACLCYQTTYKQDET